ncbi:SAM-dependent methyltransferase [Pseudoalteromonas sp. OFAV1]|uniref:HsdM family class I SAM-dependent methyltransferase n=1 Tax=Pseudoalteromonas sp. OFAV1 TaxID=2908892 RepID=UPI001F395834|nr:N-6 DNA methylase [Pseudoalteromonas sp. OFAV1]MCF2901861.1 SAM-dependent methyltransferase [Pseudoalteromonas sp. OFAV1]
MSYENQIWKSCDVIRGHVKESNIPNVMMPFFALIMMESRLVREYNKIQDELMNSWGVESKDELDEDDKKDLEKDVIDELKGQKRGYNAIIVEQGRRLRDVCKSSVNFFADFTDYLNAFDDETRVLLGIDKNSDESFLGLNSYIKNLRAKKILHEFTREWAQIDLSTFTNSDITTLEEHIKRRWADMSASTSGEHYTPEDVISLISQLIGAYGQMGAKFDNNVMLYDMAVGGGNLLYGVEDTLRKEPSMASHSYSTMGQEINDQLFALAKIESRFRESSQIEYGDTLRNDYLSDKKADVVVANPPYGVDWKSAEADVKADTAGRFPYYPAMSDGQLLFLTHGISKLKEHGKAIIVANGSPMFSGDVNSGESHTRKWLLDNDYVEAWIQLPKEEFFNTQITTYLWVINKDKPASRKDKILLINAADKFRKLKKSKGKKTNEMSAEDREWVIDAFTKFEEIDDNVKVLSKYDFYYNKQQLTLLPEDDNGKYYDQLPEKKAKDGSVSKATKVPLKDIQRVTYYHQEPSTDKPDLIFDIKDGLVTMAYWASNPEDIIYKEGDGDSVLSDVKAAIASMSDARIRVDHVKMEYWHQEGESYLPSLFRNERPCGAGSLDVKLIWQKATKKRDAGLKLTVDVKPLMERDYEIIPFAPNEDDNNASIQAFLDKWVRKEYILGENSVGVEVNFNKIFYKPVVLRTTAEIAADIRDIDLELAGLERELWG